MRLRKRRRQEAPRGVRIIHGDGRVSDCTLVRDPDDAGGCAQWMAVPPEGTVLDPETDRLTVDYLPGAYGDRPLVAAAAAVRLAAGEECRSQDQDHERGEDEDGTGESTPQTGG